MADGRQRAVDETRHDCGQLLERGLPREQGVEGRVAEEVDGKCEPLRMRVARAAHGCNGTHLARADAETSGMERPTERQLDPGVAVPAEVEDRALRREQVE